MKIKHFLLIFIIFIAYCKPKNDDKIEIDDDTISQITKNEIYKKYEIPLPIEIYKFLNEKNIAIDLSNLTPIKKNHHQNVSSKNALMLGLYSADLALCTLQDKGQITLNYSDVCFDFANELNLSAAYDKSFPQKIKRNINNKDSLIFITNTTYNRACDVMETNGMANVLPFVIYAGWIEMVYQSLQLTDNEDYKNIDSILEKSKFDNLINYIYDVQIETNAYYYNQELKHIVVNLSDLQHSIKEYEEDYSKYPELKNIIKKSREAIINGEVF